MNLNFKLITFAVLAVIVSSAAVLMRFVDTRPGLTESVVSKFVPEDTTQKIIDKNDNIVVVVIDTLRADHLPIYGYERNTAPFISTLATNGIVYEKAFSVASSTAPSSASFMTALLPAEHGVTLGKMVTRNLQKKHQSLEVNRIPDEVVTLAEYLKERGYRTFGVADNLNICEEMGFTQGFDYFKLFLNEGADKVNDQIQAWSAELKNSTSPYFLYIHYMDPHQPYNKHKQWYEPSRDKNQNKIRAYDSEINYVDDKFAHLYAELGWGKNALVVLLSDHGEEFWDHGALGHGITLYREVTHVPFLFHHRNLVTQRVSTPVQTIDLLPTIAALGGFSPLPQWRGIDIFKIAQQERNNHGVANNDRTLQLQLLRHPYHERPPLQSVIANGLQLIAQYPKDSDKKLELFDLDNDFSQQTNIFSTTNSRAKDLLDRLAELESVKPQTAAEAARIEVNPETIRQLKSLGYVN